MNLRARFAAAAIFILFSLRVEAEPFGYSMAFDQLFRIDLATGQAEFIGVAGTVGGVRIGDIEGLTFSPDGQLYAVSDGIKALLRIDPKTGAATVVGPINLSYPPDLPNRSDYPPLTGQIDPALAFSCDGKLWMTSGTHEAMWELNPQTAEATYFIGIGKPTGLAFHGNEFYVAYSRGMEFLGRFDQKNFALKMVVVGFDSLIPYTNVISLGFDSQEHLWMILNFNPPRNGAAPLAKWSEYARIDRATVDLSTLKMMGPITGPKNLEYVGLKGLAIAPPCFNTAPPTNIDQPQVVPSLNQVGMFFLALLLLLGTSYQLRRQ